MTKTHLRESYLLSYHKEQSAFLPMQMLAMPSDAPDVVFTGNIEGEVRDAFWVSKSYLSHYFPESVAPFLATHSIHLHMPYGYLHKKGPSGGAMICLMLYALIFNCQLHSSLIVSGEISLTGDIYPVGGITQKLTEALLKRFDVIAIPIGNKNEASLFPSVQYIKNMSQLLCEPYLVTPSHLKEVAL